MRTAITRIFALTLFALLIGGSVQSAHAQLDLGGRIGYDLESESVHLGAEARFELDALDFPIEIKPSVDYFFIEHFTYLTVDANGIYSFDLEGGSVIPYAGAGLGISYISFDTEFEGFGMDGSDTSVGLNLLGGAVFGSGPLRPFAEARFNTDDIFTLTGGVLFTLGQ